MEALSDERISDDSPQRRRSGRPPFEPPWYEAAAKLVAYGTPLRHALWELGVAIYSERQLKNIYRHVRFRHHYERYRWQYLQEWGTTSPRTAATLLRGLDGTLDLRKLKI